MTWFDIKYSGQTYVENLTGSDEKTLVGLGFHGYATQAQAQAHPDSANYLQMLVAANVLANHPTGGVNTPNPPGATTIAGAGAAASTISSTAALIGKTGKFLDNLTSAAFWERLAEVVIGVILISVGVAHITRAVPIATHIAKTVGVAALA